MPAGHTFYECANSRTAERTYKKAAMKNVLKALRRFSCDLHRAVLTTALNENLLHFSRISKAAHYFFVGIEGV